MNFKKGDYILFVPQTHGKYREKNNNILCYNETFKWCVKKHQSTQKRGLLSWKTKTLKQINLLH